MATAALPYLAAPGLVVVTPPGEEPLSLTAAKRQCRVDHDAEDLDIAGLITAAREHVELVCNRALVTQTLRADFDYWPGLVRLPRPRLISVDQVQYAHGTTGILTTLASTEYQADSAREPARLVLKYGKTWPDTYDALGAVQVTYTAGYGAADAVPQGIVTALKLLVGHWYRNREAVSMGGWNELPLGVRALLGPYWVGWLT